MPLGDEYIFDYNVGLLPVPGIPRVSQVSRIFGLPVGASGTLPGQRRIQ